MPGSDRLVTQYYYAQLLDRDEAVDHQAIGQVAHRGQRPGLRTAVAAAAQAPAPLIQQGQGCKGSDHQEGHHGKGGNRK